MKSSSIRARLLRSVLIWAVLWCTALAGAVWLAVRQEVDELLDDTLQSAAEGLIGTVARETPQGPAALQGPASAPVAAQGEGRRFIWQLVAHGSGARLVAASPGAPAQPLHGTPAAGFSQLPGWRVYGQPAGHDGRMLYVAQLREERREAQAEIGLAVLLAAVPMVLLALLWLSARVRHELRPLQALSLRLAHYDPLHPGATLGVAEHEELRPVQAAVDALAARLARRIAHERAFTAHAAHALRTPLAGIDAQLAVALREAPASLQPRLARVRAAAGRLQHVVAALLALFRSGAEVQRQPLDLGALAARLPVEGLALLVHATQPVAADADLVTAALLNLVDNAQRHGSGIVRVTTPAPGVLRLHDDGQGIGSAQRQALQAALDEQAYEGRTGLGLMLADLVSRAHGGRLELPATESGFAVVMHLGAR